MLMRYGVMSKMLLEEIIPYRSLIDTESIRSIKPLSSFSNKALFDVFQYHKIPNLPVENRNQFELIEGIKENSSHESLYKNEIQLKESKYVMLYSKLRALLLLKLGLKDLLFEIIIIPGFLDRSREI
uniref:Uncharacterized protein n=1 Tax=Glossina brevipalpis TaxID=37001 RepID=A0A1A9WPR5_9MUSC